MNVFEVLGDPVERLVALSAQQGLAPLVVLQGRDYLSAKPLLLP